MTSFTALHRLLGRRPGPITSEMIDEAITQGLAETADLDFKSELPPTSNAGSTDFPKDLAAMANSGSGTILYGMTEHEKRATGRVNVDLTENHERTLRSVAVSAISPPVFGLQIERVGDPGQQVVAITVPNTQEPPHLIYRNDYFGAPFRNVADTAWMKEPQIETMYRARFDRLRDRTEARDDLYSQATRGCDTATRAWLIAVAAPRSPAVRAERMTREEARICFSEAVPSALALVDSNAGVHPLEHIDLANPRTGLRSWTAPNRPTSSDDWREAHASVDELGAVTLRAAVGGYRRSRDEMWPGSIVELRHLECALGDFFGLLRATSKNLEVGEYDVQVGIEWSGADELEIARPDPVMVGHSIGPDGSSPVHFVPVRTSFNAGTDDDEFRRQLHEIVVDCVNQAGIASPMWITTP